MLDATRLDGTVVALKRLEIPLGMREIIIGKRFCSPSVMVDPRNHCIPILDIIPPKPGSNVAFIVMPLLRTIWFSPFETIGEAVEFIHQAFEVLDT